MVWRLLVQKADNGFFCEWYEENDDKETDCKNVVFEESDKETGEFACMANLLYFVKEHFGIYYSKHNKYNLEIKVVKNKEAA